VLVVAAVLATTACGARLDQEQVGALAARRNGAGTTAARGTGSTTGGTQAQAGGTQAATGATTGGAAATGGGATSGGGEGTTATADTCSPSGGATDVGVTDDSVTVGSVATVGGPVPGLFTNVQFGVKAYFAYINATQGGVCGRKLNLLTADDRLDAGVNRSETENLMPRVFGFVGGYSVVDDGGASVLDGTGIPDIGSAIGARRASMVTNFPMTPTEPSGQRNGSVGIWQYFMSAYGVRTAAIVWPAQGDARARGQAFVRDMQEAGITVLPPLEVAITETNYTGVATKIKNDRADAVMTVLEINGISRLAEAFEQVGYLPKVPYYGQQAYGQQLIKLAGPAANGAVLALNHSIVEDAPNVPEAAAFAEWFSRVNPGADLDFFAIQGWIAGSMFVHALRPAGAQPTRAKVLEQLQTFTAFDADGLIAPINPAGKVPTSCFMVVTIENGQWKRVEPAGSGFRC
jgi:ABC-type branched-subunit amino acid transport system substrate-binding protein